MRLVNSNNSGSKLVEYRRRRSFFLSRKTLPRLEGRRGRACFKARKQKDYGVLPNVYPTATLYSGAQSLPN